MIDTANTDTAKTASSNSDSNEGFINHPHLREEGATLDLADLEGGESLIDKASSVVRAGTEGLGHAQDLAQDAVGNLRGFATRVTSRVSDTTGMVVDRIRAVPETSRKMARKVNTQAHTSPWIAIGAVGAGALVIGFVAGRLMARAPEAAVGGYDFDQAVDE